MNRHSSTSFYSLLLFFIAPFWKIHAAIEKPEELKKLVQIIKSKDSLNVKLDKIDQIGISKFSVNAPADSDDNPLLLIIVTSRNVEKKQQVPLIKKLKEIADKKREIINVNAKNSKGDTALTAILDNKTLSSTKKIKVINQLKAIKGNNVKLQFSEKKNAAYFILRILKDDNLSSNRQYDLIEIINNIDSNAEINLNQTDDKGNSGLAIILKNHELKFTAKQMFIEKFKGSMPQDQTLQFITKEKGETWFSAIMHNTESFEEKMKFIDQFKTLAPNQPPIDINVKNKFDETIIFWVLSKGELNASQQIRFLKKAKEVSSFPLDLTQKFAHPTSILDCILMHNYGKNANEKPKIIKESSDDSNNVNGEGYSQLEDYLSVINWIKDNSVGKEKDLVADDNIMNLLHAIIFNKSIKEDDKIKLIDQVIELNPKAKVNLNRKDDWKDTIIIRIVDNQDLNSNYKATLIKKIYELPQKVGKLDKKERERFKALLHSAQLNKENRKMLTGITGIEADPIQIVLHKIVAYKKPIFIAFLMILSAISCRIMYNIDKHVKVKSIFDIPTGVKEK